MLIKDEYYILSLLFSLQKHNTYFREKHQLIQYFECPDNIKTEDFIVGEKKKKA